MFATKPCHFDPAKFKDEFELALRKLVKRKAAGKTIEREEEPERETNVVDLMEALKRSIKSGGRRAAALNASNSSKKTKRPGKRATHRKRQAACDG